MDIFFSKCGNNCNSCPSYKDNLMTDDDRHRCSQGWHKYLGFRLNPEKLISCDGCQPVGENKNGARYLNCIIRRCALHNEIQTCAHCASYPCQTVTSRVLGIDWVDELIERVGEIPEEDFERFVEPYLGLSHLDTLRASINPDEIVEIKAVSIQPRFAVYPPELESKSGIASVYRLITEINSPLTDLSYAQAERQKETRLHILKLLWAFALFGEFDQDRNVLTLDHEIYLAQKIHSSYDRVLSYFEILDGHGVYCEIIPLIKDRWLTPKGALRRQGIREATAPWVIEMSIDENLGGMTMMEALQQYARDLDSAYGKMAYRKFARADMQIMNRKMKD